MAMNVSLRDVTQDDLPTIYAQQLDPEANHMAAFTHKDPADHEAFMAHWARILANDAIIKRIILYGDEVAGNIGFFEREGKPEVGYWLGREYWGKGIATRALVQFLDVVETRPLYAAAAADNIASIRVLQKCGFVLNGLDRGFSNARNAEIEEVFLVLE